MVLSAPLVVKHLTTPCGGQCGGDIELVTDALGLAYASTGCYGDTPFQSGDSAGTARRADGSMEVMCGAVNAEAEERCGGSAIITDAELRAAAWAPAAHWVQLLESVD